MERIVLEVDPKVARAWREAPPEQQQSISNEFNIRIGRRLLRRNNEEFPRFLADLQNTMKERGLTQEKLDEILK
jgi:hypothetical protein